jgi:hypothetical protein
MVFSHLSVVVTINAAKPLLPAHRLFLLRRHGYHQLTCGCSPLRLRRHKKLARCVANHLSSEGDLDASLAVNLHSSLTRGTKVDLVLSSALAEHPTAIDFTVSCPLLPSYLAAAVANPHAIVTARAAEKIAKHAAGSEHRGRLFLPWVFTTFGGIGPASIWYYIDSIYASSAALARLSQTSFHAVSARKAAFLACLQATLVRSCFEMLTTHTSAPPAASSAPLPSAPDAPAATTASASNLPSPASSRATTPDPDHPGVD